MSCSGVSVSGECVMYSSLVMMVWCVLHRM